MKNIYKRVIMIVLIALEIVMFAYSYVKMSSATNLFIDFDSWKIIFFGVLVAIYIGSLILYFKNNLSNFKLGLLLLLLQFIIIMVDINYHYLTVNFAVIVASFMSLIGLYIMGLIGSEKNKEKLVLVMYLAVLYIIFKEAIDALITNLTSLDIEVVREYIASYGALAPIISILLMVLQSILAPIPAFLITFSNALVFGWVKGAIISWTGAMIGAAICFAIGRFLGRDVAEKYAGKRQLESVDNYFSKYGKVSILIARLLPFVPFDPVSYAAGLTSMSFPGFLLATGVGQIPATIVYSYFAGNVTTGVKSALWILCGVFIISTILFTLKSRKVMK